MLVLDLRQYYCTYFMYILHSIQCVIRNFIWDTSRELEHARWSAGQKFPAPFTYLHQSWIFIRWQAVDIVLRLLWLQLDEAGKAITDAVGAWNLFLPVAHIYLYHLPRHMERERVVVAVVLIQRQLPGVPFSYCCSIRNTILIKWMYGDTNHVLRKVINILKFTY